MIGALLPALVPILGDALKRLFPDAEARQRAEAELNAALLARAGELEKAAADIIKTEAQSEHWLAACWRPMMMITLGLTDPRRRPAKPAQYDQDAKGDHHHRPPAGGEPMFRLRFCLDDIGGGLFQFARAREEGGIQFRLRALPRLGIGE